MVIFAFKGIFYKKSSQGTKIDTPLELEKITPYKTKKEELEIKEEIAKKLYQTELTANDLTDEEIGKMIGYFQDRIKQKSHELAMMKEQIEELKKHIN